MIIFQFSKDLLYNLNEIYQIIKNFEIIKYIFVINFQFNNYLLYNLNDVFEIFEICFFFNADCFVFRFSLI